MFTIYSVFVNYKRTIWQGFRINVWSHFTYVLHLKKTFTCSSRANLNSDYLFTIQQFSSEGKLSYFHLYGFFLICLIDPYVTPSFHEENLH